MRHIFIALFVLGFMLCHSAECEDTAELARQIINSHRDYTASLRSFRIEYVIEDAENAKPAPLPRYTYTQIRSGQNELFFTDPDSDEYPRFPRIWSSFDGKRSSRRCFASFDPKQVLRMDVFTGRGPNPISHLILERAMGWDVLGFGTLLSMMEAADHRTIAREPAKILQADGNFSEFPSVKWSVKRFKQRDELPEHEIAAWFSEDDRWMLRKLMIYPIIVLDNTVTTGILPAGSLILDVSVLEFTDVDDQLLGHPRRFPLRIQHYRGGPEVIRLTSIAVNQPVSPELFVAEVTPGTFIRHDPGTHAERHEYSGGMEGEKLQQEMQKKENEFMGRPVEPEVIPGSVSTTVGLISAKPETLNWPVSPIIIGVSSALLIAAVIARFRSST